MNRSVFFVGLLLLLAACGKSEEPLPTSINPDSALEEAGLPSGTEQAATQTALVPTPTVFFTPTPTPTASDTFTPIPSDTPIPTATMTLNPIQQTEVYIAARRTAISETSTAQVPPTATLTPRPTLTPSNTPTPSRTPLPTVPLPDVPPPNRIVFTSNRAGSFDLWLMALDGTHPEALTLYPTSDEITASCSPDGEQFVYDSDRGGDREIYLGRYDGTPPRPLTDTEGENYAPVWSPLGDQIAFVSTREGISQIWVMDSGGGNPRKLTTAVGANFTPSWSPDGKLLFYGSLRQQNSDIFAYDFDQEAEVRLTDTDDLQETAPVLGYDLQTLAFIAETTAGDPSTGALWTTDFATPPKAVVSAGGRVDTPAWVEIGNILVSADLGGVTHILLVNLLDAQQTILTNIGPINQWARPCYVKGETVIAALPTGIPPTPTPSATPELITAYTAVINPGADWQSVQADWSLDDLAGIAPDDYRLGQADLVLEDRLLIYTWADAENNRYSLSVALEALDGGLEATIVSYTVNDLPQEFAAVQDLAFVIRENILLGSLPRGNYRLENITFKDEGITFSFRIPPEAD